MAVLAILLRSSCQNDTPKAKPLALATIHPYELLLSELLEPQIEVKSIMPINSSPHTWSPNPSDLVIWKMQISLSNGFGLENPIRPQLRRHSTKRFQISEIKGIATLDHHHEGEAEHDDEVVDPHVWTAPRQIIKILDKLVPRLSQSFRSCRYNRQPG
jgi:ABC-type Zn uptake system ZnuABC Zn-binding protein ZnuA